MHRDNVEVILNTPAPPSGLTINFSSAFPALVASPASVTLANGATSGVFTVRGLSADGPGPVTVSSSATTGSVVWQPASLQVSVVPPQLQLFSVQTTRTVGAAANNIGAEFCIAAFNCPDSLNAPQMVTFSLSNNTTDVTVSLTSVTIRQNDLATTQINRRCSST